MATPADAVLALKLEAMASTNVFYSVLALSLVAWPLVIAAWAFRLSMAWRAQVKALSAERRAAGRPRNASSLLSPSPPASPSSPADAPGAQQQLALVTLSCAFVNYYVPVKGSLRERLLDGGADITAMKQLLFDVSARFTPGTLTAIMGPSGAGKSTFLNVISGRASVGAFSGMRMLNGKPYRISRYNAFMRQQGYVLQDNILFEDLTVRETLLFSAMLALPENMPLAQKIERVDSVLDEIGLRENEGDVVGGAQFQASRGQKRRLSIAIELLRLPSLLMLDEPTTGLDATSSLKLVQTLRELATHANRTVIAVIHQPRAEIFEYLDQLLLLGEGGHCIFFGPAADAPGALEASGLDRTGYANPGDFIIDAVGLDPERDKKGFRAQTGAKSYILEMARAFARSTQFFERLTEIRSDIELRARRASSPRGPGSLSRAAASPTLRFRRRIKSNGGERRGSVSVDSQQIERMSLDATSFETQLWVLFCRRFSLITKHPTDSLFAQLNSVAVVVVLASSFSWKSNCAVSSNCELDDVTSKPYKNAMFLFFTSLYSFCVQYLTVIPEYFEERNVLIRERQSGTCRLTSYLCAAFLSETPRACFCSALLMSTGYAMLELNGGASATVLFAFTALTAGICCFQSVCCLLSCLTDDLETVYSLIFLVLGSGTLFGGLCVLPSSIPPYFMGFYYTSIPSATFRALVVNEFAGGHLEVSCAYLANISTSTISYSADATHSSANGNTALGEARLGEKICKTVDLTRIDLGKVALRFLELDSADPFSIVLLLLFASVAIRALAYFVMVFRERGRRSLKERDSASGARKLAQATGSPLPGIVLDADATV